MRSFFIVGLIALAALCLTACRGGCCASAGGCEETVVVVAQDGAEVTTHRSPGCPCVIVVRTGKAGSGSSASRDLPLPPTPFKTFKLKHNDGSPGHKKIESATVTGKGGIACGLPDRFPPPPGTGGPPHQLVVQSAPLDFPNTAWWPGQVITADPQAVYSAAFEVRLTGDPATHNTCFSAPDNKEMRSIEINYVGMQDGKYHFTGKVVYYDSFDPQGDPRYATEPIDLLLP